MSRPIHTRRKALRFYEPNLARVELRLVELTTQMETLMTLVTDIQAKITTLTQIVTDEETVIGSVKVLLDGLVATQASLNEQLKQALADLAAAGVDVAALQAVADGIDALNTKVAADKADLAQAVIDHTPTP